MGGVPGTGSGPTGSSMAASSDRYRPSRDSVSSATGEDGGDRNRGAGRMNSLSSYPDSHQVLFFALAIIGKFFREINFKKIKIKL